MKEEMKDKHNTFTYSKVICTKGCFNSYNLWKLISLAYSHRRGIDLLSHTQWIILWNRCKMFQMTVIDLKHPIN